jgi:hypothetical protein
MRREVISLLILALAGTVLYFWYGAYTFGIGGTNVQTIRLPSVTLHSGSLPNSPTCATANSAYMAIQLSNPGAATNISSVNLSGSSLTTAVSAYYLSANACTQISSTHEPSVAGGGAITSLTLYFASSNASTLTRGQTYNCVINFANGQLVSWSPISQ